MHISGAFVIIEPGRLDDTHLFRVRYDSNMPDLVANFGGSVGFLPSRAAFPNRAGAE